MATNTYLGIARAVAQVKTMTLTGAVGVATAGLTINGKTVVYTLTGSEASLTIVAQNVVSTLILAQSSVPELRRITFSSVGAVITATASTPGIPFLFTAVGTGTVTNTPADVTPSSGPQHWGTAANWSLGTVPVDTDDVVIDLDGAVIRYDMNQTGVDLNSLSILGDRVQIGLPDALEGYYEYFDRHLRLSATTVTLGRVGTNFGPAFVRMNGDSDTTAISVEALATSPHQGYPSFMIHGTGAASTLKAMLGSLAVGFRNGETSTFATIQTGYVFNESTDVIMTIGGGVTLTTLKLTGGQTILSCAATTVTIEKGQLTVTGTGAITTLSGQEGLCIHQSNGTITTLTCGTKFDIDFSRDPRTRTVTNTTMSANSGLKDSNKLVTFTNPIALANCSLSEVRLDLGSNFNLQRS